jgi:hypothetical protein
VRLAADPGSLARSQDQGAGLRSVGGGVVANLGRLLMMGALLDDPAVFQDNKSKSLSCRGRPRLLDDPAVFQDNNQVAAADRGDLVRNDDAGAAGQVLVEGLLNPCLGFGVQGACAIRSPASYPTRAMERPSSEVWCQPAGTRKRRGRMLLSGLGPAPPSSNMPPHSGLGCKAPE